MVCKKCGKIVPAGKFICPECNGGSISTLASMNNKISSDGRMSEYITERYNQKKGVYGEKNNSNNSPTVIGIIVVLTIVAILMLVAFIKFLGN